MNIDLVYLWVDDTDYDWKRKILKYRENFSNYDEDAINPCRFYNNDELKYSLRSVEKYAPWIRKIFIVTDNQIPKWLNTDNPKIRIVDHKEIIPEKYLPLFNSCAIESRLPFIPDLSEYFLYANDDTLFWNSVDEDFFFKEEKPIFRMEKFFNRHKRKRLYGKTIQRAYDLVSQKYNCDFYAFYPHHNIDSYRKSVFMECIKVFQKEFDDTMSNRFREESDIQRSIVAFYSIAEGKGILKPVRLNLIQKICGIARDSSCFNLRHNISKNILKKKTKLICLNDSVNTTDKIREKTREILEQKFSEKSSFER